MKSLKWFCIVLVPLVFIQACCKKDSTQQPISYPSYSKLAVGNYWIYGQFTIDTMGNATTMNIYDSVYVEKDTIINNQTYFKVYKPMAFIIPAGYAFLRDSLHYIINSSGAILFSSEDFTTVFNEVYHTNGADTTYRLVTKMEDKDATILTPAGAFTTSDFRHTYYMYPNYSGAGNPRYLHSRYAKDVGLVAETFPFYSLNPNYVERRLVRFHVN